MRIRKYDFDYGRRTLLRNAAAGAGAGVLAPLWSTVAESADITKAYPEELLHIEAYTKGKVKIGDTIDASNVDVVKDLFDPIAYTQIKTMGRRVTVVETTKDVTRLFPHDYLNATLSHQGQAKLDETGNVWANDGGPWLGGLPFPDAKTGLEAAADITLSWGRHDFALYGIREWDMDPSGDQSYQYDYVWAEMSTTGRMKGPALWNGRKDLLRFQSVWFTAPQDTAGSSFLSTWYYDQRKFPELYGYLPAFKRVRQFPTNQRFEPLVPGITFFLSDAWGAGDPMLTWGNYKIVERKPHLACTSKNWLGKHANWEKPRHGGPKGKTFFDTYVELVPEAIVLDAEPSGYPRAPVSRKRVWIDARNGQFCAYVTYDRRGQIWKSFEAGMSQFVDGDTAFKEQNGYPAWSWVHVMSHDIQANRMSLLNHVRETSGGYKTVFSDEGQDVYNKYLTNQAMQRLGSA